MLGENLRLTRQQRGWTLESLSSQTNIPVSSLSEFETGSREPRLGHLQVLARTYGRPIASFFEPRAESEVVLWRERPADAHSAKIEGEFLELCRRYRSLEDWCGEHVRCALPEHEPNGDRIDWAGAQTLANLVRNQLNLGSHPSASLLTVLENTCGVRIFHLKFEPTGTAACTRDAHLGMAVLLNASSKRWRRNFDLAHELFHLLTWKFFRQGDNAKCATAREEQLADCFASALLMPEDALKDALGAAARSGGGLKRAELFDVARQFDVSVEALLWRLRVVFNRSEPDTRHDITVCKSMQSQLEIREDTAPRLLPERYHALARRALRNGELSVGRAAEYLGISRKEAMALDDFEDIDDEPISLGLA